VDVDMKEAKISISSGFNFDRKIRRCIILEQDVVGYESAHSSLHFSCQSYTDM
jgi:hypothetical protein